MVEKRFDVPGAFACNLRKQKTTAPATFDNQAVPSDFDFVQRSHLALRTEDRNFEGRLRKLGNGDRWKSRIGVGHGASKMRNDAGYRPIRFEPAKTAAQIITVMN